MADKAFINKDITQFASQRMRHSSRSSEDWTSRDFYNDPLTMSYFFLEALEEEGFGYPKGWRSDRATGSVEALMEDEKIVRILSAGGELSVVDV
ncbi:uncharacterized protein METZ01_LOCUS470880, partial [marine metagenome]